MTTIIMVVVMTGIVVIKLVLSKGSIIFDETPIFILSSMLSALQGRLSFSNMSVFDIQKSHTEQTPSITSTLSFKSSSLKNEEVLFLIFKMSSFL